MSDPRDFKANDDTKVEFIDDLEQARQLVADGRCADAQDVLDQLIAFMKPTTTQLIDLS